jgi:nucleoside phosphorylase
VSPITSARQAGKPAAGGEVIGMRRSRVTRLAALAASVALLAGPVPAIRAATGGGPGCTPRTLVLSAMPLELGPIYAETKVERTVTVDAHDYYVGSLHGRNVVLSLTGIGPVNAANRTKQALRTFRCGHRTAISDVVFSGVAGGNWIGNVIVPDRWTLDHGKTFTKVDPRFLATARKVARSKVALEQQAPAGDPACGCVVERSAAGTVSVTHKPEIQVGGPGDTTDPFTGRALPCAPGGGDVFGCEPCALQEKADHAPQFATGVVPFADPNFFRDYGKSTATSGKYVAEDEETAAVAIVAAKSHLPFIGFRAVSDGGGDPLGLPGFPVQFFYYRQLAADNAALVTMAFLAALH